MLKDELMAVQTAGSMVEWKAGELAEKMAETKVGELAVLMVAKTAVRKVDL